MLLTQNVYIVLVVEITRCVGEITRRICKVATDISDIVTGVERSDVCKTACVG